MLSRRTPFVNCQQRSAQSMRLAALPRSASAGQQAPLALSAGILAALLFNPVQPAAAFGPVSIKLDNIQIERIDCGAGISTTRGVTFSGSSSKAACLDLTATATNPNSKPVYNADVFGRVYDKNGDSVLDDTENIRISYINEVPAGSSTVHFRLNVPAEQYEKGPISLQSFKATGFPGKNLPGQGSGTIDIPQCEIDGDCADAEEALIR